ncbi:MAG TPA: metallophosphoesterase [Bryobacteraceae bacterium]|nr:metallophosphoesterase [Bryobacteraceae bacterium]
MITRRELLACPGMALAAAAATPEFQFVHLTDLHIQPELKATENCVRCIETINEIPADFSIAGGDLVFDANLVSRQRAGLLFDLYEKTTARLKRPLRHVIGNHDLFGIGERGKAEPANLTGSKKSWETSFGKRYRSFDHKGWHFVLLDTIDVLPDGGYRCFVDAEQMHWLENDLKSMPKGAPLLVVTHAPLVTGFLQYSDLGHIAPHDALVVTNSKDVCDLLFQYNLKAVLQGHTHVCENVQFRGCQFITTGAVCGNWWKGPRFGSPEGFGVVKLRGDVVEYRYQAYAKA